MTKNPRRWLLLSLAALLSNPVWAGTKEGAGLYELRTYTASPGKLDALLTRFREHTTKLFERHGMENVGYWVPADGGDTLIYLLKHKNREAAEASWRAFRDDAEWKKVKAESEKDGTPLAAKVVSIYLDPTDYSPDPHAVASGKPRVYELRTYVASPGKLGNLNERFRKHTMALFKSHGMENIGYWVPADADKGRDSTLIYLLAHETREAAARSWKAFSDDPEWQKVYKDSQPDGIPLAAKVESIYLTPTDFSRMK